VSAAHIGVICNTLLVGFTTGRDLSTSLMPIGMLDSPCPEGSIELSNQLYLEEWEKSIKN
jgi:hypothetical protein